MPRRQATGARRWVICARSAIIPGWRRATWQSTAPPAGSSARSRSPSVPGLARTPKAKMSGRPLTSEHHETSPSLADPYHLLDLSLVSDGGIAFILTTADRAKDRPKPPVYVLGQGFGEVSADLWWEKKNFTHM